MPMTIDGTPFSTSAGEAHERREPGLAVFGEIDAGDHPDGDRHDRSDDDQEERPEDRVGHAAARFADGPWASS
jgi:hypothetical protein